ncbi:HPF/RaiA family ribosome-associated protein [Actinocorallia aurantiaca]|uniref:HPF/RaiA family ribosome-associated protein n=1 Tax=Actinocorallia aurantiaca TaxID=46204 RepID=A0ABN3UNC4_9ACTN
MTRTVPQVNTQSGGKVPQDLLDRAREKVERLCGRSPEQVLAARVRLSMGSGADRPAVAQANLDVNGRTVRVQTTAATMGEAVDLLEDRLAERLRRVARNWEAVRGGRPQPDEWRHDSEPARRPAYYPRPAEERQVIRHKAYELASATPDEAVFDMEALDYDFHLFTDVATGQDSVVYRHGDAYRMAQIDPRPRKDDLAVDLTVSPHPAPRIGVREAEERLEATGLPFVFFADADTGRGNVLYHRYDGHYGLITPAG